MATLSKNGINNAMSLMNRMRVPGFYEEVLEKEGVPQRFLEDFISLFEGTSPMGQRDPAHGFKTTSERMRIKRGEPWGNPIKESWFGDWQGWRAGVDGIRITISNEAPHFWAIAGKRGTPKHRIPLTGEARNAKGKPGLRFTWQDYPGRSRPPGSPEWGPKGEHEGKPGFRSLLWADHPGATHNPFFYNAIKFLRPKLAEWHKDVLKDRLIQLFGDYGFKLRS